MPNAPLREIGTAGVNTDVDPYDLNLRQFTFASNARFTNKRIERGPVFSTTGTLVVNTSPRYALSYNQPSGINKYHICNRDGTITDWASAGIGAASTETDISYASWTPANYDTAFTHTLLQDVVYVNREDRVPWFRAKNGTTFDVLPNVGSLGWDPSWRAGSIRSVGEVLVAINVTKGGTSYPTMVKTSDYPAYGQPPAEWVASSTNSATENILANCDEALIDGWPLRDKLVLYTENETWLMEPRYDSLMFDYRRIFSQSTSCGMLAHNCVTEHNNRHFVFGANDIWTHDGFNHKSIATNRVRSFIYDNMDRTQKRFFFVQHIPAQNEILFCFVSDDPFCHFPKITDAGCNRAAVYNYTDDAWYFYDLPYVIGAAQGVPFTGAIYSDFGAVTYAGAAGAYAAFGDSEKRAYMMIGTGQAVDGGTLDCAVRAFGLVSSAAANGVLDTLATAPLIIEKRGIDLDDLQLDIAGYKVIKHVRPECRISDPDETATFSFTSRDNAGTENGTFDRVQTYDGRGRDKLDFMSSGRFIDYRIDFDGYSDFRLSGIDFDVTVTGHR